jgi:hypothetical protein
MAASSTAGLVVKARVCAHPPPLESDPQTRKEYEEPAARPDTFSENGPLAPAGQVRLEVPRWGSVVPVRQYSNELLAGPSLALPRAFSLADSGPMSVAGSVEA